MKCGVYCRVSTDRQREAGTNESQREVLLHYARTNGWTVVSVEEDDGFSGTVPAWERPGMSRALRLIESRAVDYLLVVDLDRTSRAEDPFERAIVRKALRDHGVLLATPKGILRDITPEEKLTQDMLSSVASYERSKTRERTLCGRKDAVQKYRPRGAPKGTPREEGTKFIVRRSIQDMLANPLYCSERWAPNPAWDPNFTVPIEPVVTREAWEAADTALNGRPRPPARPLKYDYLLRAVAYRSRCNRKLRGQTTPDGTARYRCEFAHREQVNCERCTARNSVRADELEPLVWNYVRQLNTEPGYFRAEVERAVEADQKRDGGDGAEAARTLRADLERLALERSRVQAGFRKGLYTEDEVTELAAIERERAPLLNRLELAQMDERSLNAKSARLAAVDTRLPSMRGAVDTVDRDQQRAIIAELIERVTVVTETREVEIRVLVGEAPAADDDAGNGGTGPTPRRAKGGRRSGRGVPESYGAGLSGGSVPAPDPRRPALAR